MRKRHVSAAIFCSTFFVTLTLSAIPQQRSSGSNPTPGASALSSQTTQSDKADPDTPEADDSLNLTDDQKARIKSIREDSQEQLKAMQKDRKLGDEERQKKTKQIKMDTRKQVWRVLTPEQKTRWAEEARERREAKSHPNPQ